MSAEIDQLMRSFEGLAVDQARKYWRPGMSGITLEELIHEGKVGLFKAARKWQEREEKNISFSTFAFRWIRHELYAYILMCRDVIRVPRQRTIMIQQERRVFTVSLDEAIIEGGTSRMEFVADESERAAYDQDECDLVHLAISQLKPHDGWLLRERFLKDRTLQSIGEEMGITREAVRLQERAALQKVRMKIKTLQRKGMN